MNHKRKSRVWCTLTCLINEHPLINEQVNTYMYEQNFLKNHLENKDMVFNNVKNINRAYLFIRQVREVKLT